MIVNKVLKRLAELSILPLILLTSSGFGTAQSWWNEHNEFSAMLFPGDGKNTALLFEINFNNCNRYVFGDSINEYENKIKGRADSNSFASFTLLTRDGNGLFRVFMPEIDTSFSRGNEVILSAKGGWHHRFYNITNNKLEWEIVLEGPPASNCISYQIETEKLGFYYQDPDTFEAHRADWHFAADIPGSYAVYCRDKKVGSGKAFHIYRPRAWDFCGDSAWCDIYIDTLANRLSITLPCGFKENAVYPITIDPVFGYTEHGATGIHLDLQNYRHQVNYQDPQDADGSMLKAYICGYRTSSSAACTATVVVYSYDSTLANCARVATSGKIAITKFATGPDSAVWFSAPISGTLENNEEYIVSWQGYEDCSYCLRVCADYTGIWGFEKRYTYSDWGTNNSLAGYSSNGYQYSVYVEYQESGVEGNPYIRHRKIKRGH